MSKEVSCLYGDPVANFRNLEAAESASTWTELEVSSIAEESLNHVRSYDTEDSVQAIICATQDLMGDDDPFVYDIGLYSKLVEQLWGLPKTGHIPNFTRCAQHGIRASHGDRDITRQARPEHGLLQRGWGALDAPP